MPRILEGWGRFSQSLKPGVTPRFNAEIILDELTKWETRMRALQSGALRVYRFHATNSAENRITSYNVCYTKLLRIPNRKLAVRISDAELESRRAAEKLKGPMAFKPAGRERVVSAALKAYATMAANASKGAVRIVPE